MGYPVPVVFRVGGDTNLSEVWGIGFQISSNVPKCLDYLLRAVSQASVGGLPMFHQAATLGRVIPRPKLNLCVLVDERPT